MSAARLIDKDVYILLDDAAALSNVGANGLIYLPYLMGERTPHLDPDCRGVFFGLSAKHEKRDMIRSIMEGVAYSLKNCLDIIQDMGVEINEVRASGGGGKSKLWRQIQADLFGRDISTVNSSEGPAFGAALLAGVGSGLYSSVEEACDATVKVVTTQSYDQANHQAYGKYYSLYNKLYHSLKSDFKVLADIQRVVK